MLRQSAAYRHDKQYEKCDHLINITYADLSISLQDKIGQSSHNTFSRILGWYPAPTCWAKSKSNMGQKGQIAWRKPNQGVPPHSNTSSV